MKKIALFVFVGLVTLSLNAQDNKIESTGNVGIGTTIPSQKLEVKDGSIYVHGSSTGQGRLVLMKDNGGNQFEWYPQDAGLKLFNRTSGNSDIMILNNGRIGINSSNPIYGKFQVNQSIDASNQGIAILNSTGQRSMRLWTDNTKSYIYSGTGANDLILNTTGKIGIGTASPSQLLEISDGNGINGTSLIEFNDRAWVGYWSAALYLKSGSGKNMIFATDGDKEAMRINTFGKVGVGLNTPSAKLDVFHSSNEDWSTKIKNTGGSGKGLLIQAGSQGNSTNPILQLEDINNNVRFFVASNGRTIINGSLSTKEVEVKQNVWPDFVFEPTYKLKTLEEVEKYIKANKHLPDVPSEKEVKENGLSLGQSDAVLLQKIEELTLYLIEQNKTLKKQNEKILELEREINELRNMNN